MSKSIGEIVVLPSSRSVFLTRYTPSSVDAHNTNPVPILFIHGLNATHVAWVNILPFLRARTCITFDLPGHGRSPSFPVPTATTLAEDARDVLTHSNARSADVVAHSGGCIVALALASSFPDAVRTLILLAPPSLPIPREAMLGNAQALREKGPTIVAGILVGWLGQRARADASKVSLLEAETCAQDGAGVASVVEALAGFDWVPSEDDARKIRRAVVMWGTQDPVASGEAAARLAAMLGGTAQTLETGHFMMLEDPQAVGEALQKILDTESEA